MNRIAEAECATCHLIRPKTEMREVRVRRQSGSSYGIWQGSRSKHLGGGYRESYSHRDMWVCRTCKAPKSDSTPVQDALIGFLVLIGLYFLYVFLAADNDNHPVAKADPADQHVLSDQSGTPSPSNGAVESTSNPAEHADKDALASMWPSKDESTAKAVIIDPRKWQRRIDKALETGSPQRWSQDGERGYFVPSEASTSSTGTCRNLSVSTDDGETAAFGTYCQSDGEEWVRR